MNHINPFYFCNPPSVAVGLWATRSFVHKFKGFGGRFVSKRLMRAFGVAETEPRSDFGLAKAGVSQAFR
jgi:hypothetical protein